MRKILEGTFASSKKEKKYNLLWQVDKITKETILTNVNRGLAESTRKKLKNTTHTMGKLVIKSV
jgi:hypothetical protein